MGQRSPGGEAVKFGNRARQVLWIVVAFMGIAGCSRDAGQSMDSVPVVTGDPALRAAILDEQDARGKGVSGIESLSRGLTAPEAELQRLAVRAIGRLEDPQFIPLILPLLFSDDETVRSEAVNALGQAAFRTDGDEVADVLFEYLVRERQEGPAVRAVIGRTLGRLRYADAIRFRRAVETLVDLTREGGGDAPLVALTGAVMGLESLARRGGRTGMSLASVERLLELTAFGRPDDAVNSANDSLPVGTDIVGDSTRLIDPARVREMARQALAAINAVGTDVTEGPMPDSARVRRVALSALYTIGKVELDVIEDAIHDPDPDVRRLAVMALALGPTNEGTTVFLLDGLADPSPRVRVEAVRIYATWALEARECPLLFSAVRDEDLHVALTALDLLQQTCENRPEQEEILTRLVAGLVTAGPLDWHRGAHALVSLAGVSPDVAAAILDGAVQNTNPFVRMYAARAATKIGSADVLEALAKDPAPNVRTLAVQGLSGLVGHGADGVLVAQLDQDDPQLLLTVAELLEGTAHGEEAVGPLVAALLRVSQGQRETDRDPRLALLERIYDVGSGEEAAELEPYLNDYDPIVAARVAEILTEWTGEQRAAQPTPLQRQVLPSAEELERLGDTRIVLEMARGGEIEIRLSVTEAPTHVARFARLVSSGYFDGLTFHRVVTNYVVQGGSPGANEYTGDAAYTRDEVGLVSHWRGTVATSTRGRDTGDGQIFINLVDNLRLNHDYTVFGEVVSGMDVADQVAEGDVIVRATVVVE
jgi:cyclophilin family peptidyl-prolyl cis-trans isomerase